MRTLSAETAYSRRLDLFFKRTSVDAVLLVLISASVIAAVASLLYDQVWLEHANLWFSGIFSVELSARYFTYSEKNKKEYFLDWWMDWIATIPWDILLFFLFPGGGASMLRLLRLPRIFRLLRFRHMKRSETGRWLSYRFRRLLEVSIFRQIMVMLAVSLILVWIFTVVLDNMGVESEHGGNFWFSIITMISSDSLFEVQEMDIAAKALILIFSFIGIILFNGILLAIIIGKLMEHLDDLKSGRGDVREKGHIVLLGWSECIPHILDELEIHCIVERKRLIKVVIMRESLPDAPDQVVESRPHVEVIQRIGSFQNEEALERISAHKAAAVIVLGGHASDRKLSERLNDPIVTRTLISLETLLEERTNESAAPVVILNYFDLSSSYHVTEFLRPFGDRSRKLFFNPLFFAGKLLASMCSNPYAEDIYNELLTAEGNEFHFVRLPGNQPRIWRDLIGAFPKAVPVGFRNGDGLRMAPLPDDPLPEGAEVLVLSANSYEGSVFEPVINHKVNSPSSRGRERSRPERISEKETPPGGADARVCPALRCTMEAPSGDLYIVGVNQKLPFIVEEMHKVNSLSSCGQGRESSPGSSLGVTVHIVDNQTGSEFADWYAEYSKSPLPEGVLFHECRFRSEDEVRAAIDFDSAIRIILLADGHLQESATPDQIDAETVSKLLMLSHMIEARNKECDRENLRMIVETLTVDSEVVVRNIRNCSNVIGPLTIGRLLTTFTLQPEFEGLFRTLIQFGDIDIVCRRASDALPGRPVETLTFGDLLTGAVNGCIPLGWVHAAPQKEEENKAMRGLSARVELNPPKNARVPEGSEIVFLQRQGDR
jgi:hypothetical protein